MTLSLPSYPAYKPSGVDWLGDVPAHWCTTPLKRWVRMNSEVLPETTDPEYVFRYLDIGTVGTGRLTRQPQMMRFGDSPSRARRLVRSGDTIVSTVRTYLKAVYYVSEDALDLICSTGFCVLRPNAGTMPEFVSYVAQSDPFTDWVTANSAGTAYPAIAETRLGSQLVAVPPLPEQTAIVRYLDAADRRLRRAIRAKQKLIALLEEQKQAIIARAVMRGLEPNVALKPSGVDWLGDAPAHWEVVRLGRLFAQRNEVGFPELPILEVSLRTGVRIRDFGHSDRKQVMTDRSMYKRAAEGDIAYNMMRMWQGAVGAVPVDGLVSPAYVVAKPLAEVEPCYFTALFRTRTYMDGVNRYSRGIVKDRNRLYWEDFKRMPAPCPPPGEQAQIVSAIERQTATLENGIVHILQEIALLREYRARLIADVVTGKLDVREAAGRLPVEEENAEPLDMLDVGDETSDSEDEEDGAPDVVPDEEDEG